MPTDRVHFMSTISGPISSIRCPIRPERTRLERLRAELLAHHLPSAAGYVGSKHFIAGFSEALDADLAGTGVTVTQVCPGPVESEFDEVAGSAGGMIGGLPNFLRIAATQCAREAVTGFERGDPLVFPGRAYRLLMRMLPFVPRWLHRNQAAKVAIRRRRQ
jgi:uncharacterized protein